uniref:Uncharacterized protein n=1 Tax=Rhizophagus irregularis (strain DAOM 181602 / DAOM 197198 / MUCL 43194) TaxID=747089 RepID=U9T2K3_RHIID
MDASRYPSHPVLSHYLIWFHITCLAIPTEKEKNVVLNKQDDDSKVSQKNTNTTKLDKKYKETKRAKKIVKSLDGIDKLTVLADIRLMLRKLGVS